LLFSEFDVINARKIFVKLANVNHIIQDTLVKNGNKEKEQINVNFVFRNLKNLMIILHLHLKQFAERKSVKKL
jgi:hypothetical protein